MWRECGEAAACPSPTDPSTHRGISAAEPRPAPGRWNPGLRCSFCRLPSAWWGHKGQEGLGWETERGLTLEKILLVGVRNARSEWKRKDKNDRNGYLDCIHDVLANGIYFTFLQISVSHARDLPNFPAQGICRQNYSRQESREDMVCRAEMDL